ncbi:MAG: SDR family NAD(P)-dependent oxidoreductase [Mycobacteriaceae bacterium]|nr:SDR family NAD(P)-dependent oxidoreductase [Mycobacteriaceae bacterium]
MSTWGVADIPDQQGRTFLITGANSGLGAVAARALADRGASVVLACRDVAKGQMVADGYPGRARVVRLDLADLASVRECAAALPDPIDVLINNAGVMAVPFRRTVDGFEMQVGTNHLGHFALTGLLLGRIRDRVVTVSSGAHHSGRVDLADLNWERRPYRRWAAYGQAKLANLMFTYELQRRLTAAGSSVLSVAAHPGYAATNLQSHTESALDRMMALGNRLFAQSAAMGALPELYAAAMPVGAGAYYGPESLGGMRGGPTRARSSAASRDIATASGLWELSERLTRVTYEFD